MKLLRLFVVVVTIASVCTSQVATAAPPPFRGTESGNLALIIQDVALNPGGKLAIQVVDPQGKPHAGTPIKVRKAGTTVHHSMTGKDGQIVLSRLRPGVYEITSGARGGIYRLWAPQTAPPQATTGILLTDDGGVVRGSRGGWQKAALIGGGIITSGVLGGVIGYNLKDAS